MRVYIADLGHNLLTFSSDSYPLGAANMAAFLAKNVRGAKLDISLFREPQDLKKALDAQLPDVLGLSNYTWNEELAYQFARYAKARSSNVLTVMGGPNWPLTPAVQERFLRDKPMVDAYVDGPTYEGERAFQNLIERHIESKLRIEGTLASPIAGNTWIDGRNQEFVKGAAVPRIEDLDEIPSPYVGGLMDAFFDTGYFPMLQISRGCPFTCTFCNSGVAGNSKVYAHSVENVKADLAYIAKRIKPEITLCFADDNFGMYQRDEEIADYLAWLQDTHKWPQYIRTTTGKNNGARIIRVMRKVRGVLPMTSAVQSMNPVVLANIKRDNIKLETYRELQDELHAQGMQSYGELILSLPGETKQTFLDAIEKFLDNGAKRVSAHQLMLLHGAELANPDSRERFGFQTKWRLVARNIGNYTGEPVCEVEEMVVGTPTMNYADYLELREFHLLLTTFFYEGNFEEAFQFAARAGVKAFDLVRGMQALLDEASPGLRQVVDGFRAESEGELFDSREAVLDFASTHYAKLVDGTLGGNLLSKYSMMGRFYATHAAIDFLQLAILRMFAERGITHDQDMLATVMDYLHKVALHAPFEPTMQEQVEWTTRWDLERWVADRYERPLAEYLLLAPQTFVGTVKDDRRKLITTKVRTFGEHASGLGKFTRTMFARDLRRTFAPRN